MFGARGVAVGAVVAFTKGFCKAAKYSFSFFFSFYCGKDGESSTRRLFFCGTIFVIE